MILRSDIFELFILEIELLIVFSRLQNHLRAASIFFFGNREQRLKGPEEALGKKQT